MALLKCPVCGGDVSDAASACPSCGHPRSAAPAPARQQQPPGPPPQSGTPAAFFIMLIGTLLVMVSLVGAAGWYMYHRFQAAVHRDTGPELVDYQDTVATDSLHVPLPGVLTPDSAYEHWAVQEQPSLANIAEVRSALARNYPPLLRDAGVTGQVTLRMRVDASGVVDPETITVEQSTHDAFSTAATRVAGTMRFVPAKIHRKPVPVWITIPVTFQLAS